jgi:hypothetical protein
MQQAITMKGTYIKKLQTHKTIQEFLIQTHKIQTHKTIQEFFIQIHKIQTHKTKYKLIKQFNNSLYKLVNNSSLYICSL